MLGFLSGLHRLVDGPLGAVLLPNQEIFPVRWQTSRFEPNEFVEGGLFEGRTNTLRMTTTSAEGSASRPGGQQGTFYDLQARSLPIWGGPGSILESDLFIPAAWADKGANGSIRTGIFANAGSDEEPTTNFAFTFLEFSNDEGGAQPRTGAPGFFWWDNAGSYTRATAPVNYDAWNRFSMVLLREAPGTPFVGDPNTNNYFFAYYINREYVGGFYNDVNVDNGRNWNGFGFFIYNFYQPAIPGANAVDYSVYWSRPTCQFDEFDANTVCSRSPT